MSAPQLRFKDKAGRNFPLWEPKTIGDYVLSHKGGAPLTPSDFIQDGAFEVIPKKAISSGGKLKLDEVEPTYCSADFFESNQRSVIDNHYLITTLRDLVPRGPSIGYIVKFTNDKQYILAQGVYGIQIKKELLEDFLIQYSNTDNYRVLMQTMMVGSTQVHIRNSDFFKTPISVPSVTEQTKIASFLTAVDEKISQLTKKRELLTQYKKGVMQQIFSQELRFKDDDGQEFSEWQETSIGKVLTIGSGKDYKHLSAGEIPVYGTGGYMLSVNNYLYDGESVCIGRKGTIDKPTLLSGKFWTVDTLFYTHSFKNCLPKFIYAYFQTIDWKNHNEASGVPSLSKSTIEKIGIKIPVVAEQTKIANFLTAIDNKIANVQAQLAAAKQYKQGLLQQMFV